MIVHLKDGQQVEYSMDAVSFVELVTPSKAPSQTAEPTAVDLGLSVLWADCNLGATESTEVGEYLEFESVTCPDGWRLPTETEWQELYDKCSWTWQVFDGIGGRWIGNPEDTAHSIFLPASGVVIGEKPLMVGALGIYWTSEMEGAEAKGEYFDSANIYSIEYPVQNRFSVRLVKDKE